MKIDWDNVYVRLAMCGRSRRAAGVTNDGWVSDKIDNCLWLVWAGEGEILTRHGWVSLRPGACLWCRPDWEYKLKYNPDNPIGNYFVHFNLFDGQDKLYKGQLPPEKFFPPDAELAEASIRRIVHLILRSQNEDIMAKAAYKSPEATVATKLITGILIDIDAYTDGDFGPICSNDTHHRAAMFEAVTRLSESSERQPNIADLAKELGYGVDHFTRVFKRIIGRTPKAYALSASMHKAASLLRNSGLPVKQISALAGYESVYSFSAQFKRSTGVSPTAYRDMLATALTHKFDNIGNN